jgi:hypothetical protein
MLKGVPEMGKISFLVAISLLVLAFVPVWGSTWYVDGSVSASGDGTTWATAFKKIQEGIDAASDGDTVIVAQGTYVENIRFEAKNIALQSTDPLDPSVVANTIIDGNKASYVVGFYGTEDETCSLSGFTIKNGEARFGGGILGEHWDDVIHATVENNIITANTASANGGGLHSCDGRIAHNTITANWGGMGGGGLSECGGIIQSNTIIGNSASYGGGLSYCDGTIQNNAITGNLAYEFGGGLYGCYAIIQNNTISANSARADGGGLHWCRGTIQNNVITGNSAGEEGGGMHSCGRTIQNNTITGNSALVGGGLYACGGAIRDCIIWGNTASSNPQLYGSNTPVFSCIEGWSGAGEGNIASEPRFVNPEAHDYHLQEDSPCIDAGANHYWFTWPQRDLDGNCRLMGLAVDMGCYEYGSSTDADGDLLSDADESAAGTDPLRDDSDGDGLRDGLELLRGSDPLQVTPAGTLNVPSGFPTIQESLCVSVTGDEIIVAPGTYGENLHFCGPDIILRGSDPGDATVVAHTIIDGNDAGSVVTFAGTENETCVVRGFTIRHGGGLAWAAVCGGTRTANTHATIENNVITRNSGAWGGGISGCDGTIRNNIISENSAVGGGGGLNWCNGTISNNVIVGNWAGMQGGGLGYCSGTIQNNVIVGNSSDEVSGGLYWCDGMISNNVIMGNSATEAGGGAYACAGTIVNCIIWGNKAPEEPQVDPFPPTTYSCIQDWTRGGEGNISGDPQFADPDGPDDDPNTWEDNDYRLLRGSPCIDAGKNEEWMRSAVDLDGNPRIFYGNRSLTVDMGAYEYGSWPFKIVDMTGVEGGALLTWKSRVGDTYTVWSCLDLLTHGWVEEASVASQGASTFWIDVSTAGQQKFYRIELK